MATGRKHDPAKVTRSAVENAASIGAMILTTEALVTDKPEKNSGPMMPPGGMGGMDYEQAAASSQQPAVSSQKYGPVRANSRTGFRMLVNVSCAGDGRYVGRWVLPLD